MPDADPAGASLVLPGLWVGGLGALAQIDQLGVTHVVVRSWLPTAAAAPARNRPACPLCPALTTPGPAPAECGQQPRGASAPTAAAASPPSHSGCGGQRRCQPAAAAPGGRRFYVDCAGGWRARAGALCGRRVTQRGGECRPLREGPLNEERLCLFCFCLHLCFTAQPCW